MCVCIQMCVCICVNTARFLLCHNGVKVCVCPVGSGEILGGGGQVCLILSLLSLITPHTVVL